MDLYTIHDTFIKIVSAVCIVKNITQVSLYVEVEVNLWLTLSRPVRPGVGHPSGTRDQFFFLLEISFRQLRLCYFVAPSLTRGRVCNLLYNCFWALPEQSLLGRSPAIWPSRPYFTVSSETSPTWRARFPYYIPQEHVGPVLPSGTGFPFCRLLQLAGTTVEVF
jgi:hypothetical protein